MKAMIIMGPAGSGKTKRAEEEARKRGGKFVVVFWEDLRRNRFTLGAAMASEPETIIVEGLSVTKAAERAYLKQLVAEDELLVEESYTPRRAVRAPWFIFTMQSPLKMDLTTLFDERRFEVVEVL